MPDTGWTEDYYFKRRISYTLHRQQFVFDTAELLFSTDEVDLGTQLLLRQVLDATPQVRAALDLGCGYGAIGIVLAKRYPEAQVVMSDKDLLAVRYARHNAHLNGVTNATAVGSIGVAGVPDQPFDLILSNVPGHIGDRAVETDFMLGPLRRLAPGGSYWFVVVTPLAALIEQVARAHELPLSEAARRKGHVVYRLHARPEG